MPTRCFLLALLAGCSSSTAPQISTSSPSPSSTSALVTPATLLASCTAKYEHVTATLQATNYEAGGWGPRPTSDPHVAYPQLASTERLDYCLVDQGDNHGLIHIIIERTRVEVGQWTQGGDVTQILLPV